jgi:hypothetical protein
LRWHRNLLKHRPARTSVHLALLRITVAPSTVWEMLKAEGINPLDFRSFGELLVTAPVTDTPREG